MKRGKADSKVKHRREKRNVAAILIKSFLSQSESLTTKPKIKIKEERRRRREVKCNKYSNVLYILKTAILLDSKFRGGYTVLGTIFVTNLPGGPSRFRL